MGPATPLMSWPGGLRPLSHPLHLILTGLQLPIGRQNLRYLYGEDEVMPILYNTGSCARSLARHIDCEYIVVGFLSRFFFSGQSISHRG